MASLDALRHASIGRYYPTGSPVHRMDPRAKMLFVALATVAMVLAEHWATNLALLGLVLGLAALARLSGRHVLGLVRPLLPVFLVLAALQVLFGGASNAAAGEGAVLISWRWLVVTTGGLLVAAGSLVRLLNLVLLVGLLTSTTSTSGLSTGLETLLRPLDRIGLPGHELALVGAIALRFMPILGEEFESVLRAQRSRGAGLESQSRWHPVESARRVSALVVPVFADALRRVDEMTTAMLARCYQGGRGRTHYRQLAFGLSDHVTVAAGVLILAAVVVLR